MISNALIDELIQYAQSTVPKEMCGLLFYAEIFQKAPNVSKDPCRSFTIKHRDYFDICANHVEPPLAIVHSHPGRGAVPSVEDLKLMDAFAKIGHPMDFIIVGLKPIEIRCFRKVGDLYNLEWLHAVP